MFPGLSADVIDAVAAAVGGSPEAALEALLAMQGGGSDAGAATSPQQQQEKSDDTEAAAHPAGETSGSSSNTTATPSPSAAASAAAADRESLWSCVPRECKQLIIDRLSMRDLARSARSCHELASYARAAVRNLKTISVPPVSLLILLSSPHPAPPVLLPLTSAGDGP